MDVIDRVEILNGRIDRVTLKQSVELLLEVVASGARGWVVTVNVAILMMMREDPFLQDFAARALLVVPDGQPLVWVAPWLDPGHELSERVAGIDLFMELCGRAAEQGLPVYLMGSTRDVVADVARALRQRFPLVRIAGTADGFFSEAEAPERARAIRESGAKLLFVAMGVPRQERFIEKHWDALGVNLAVPVGGTFDVVAGRRRRAPVLVQKLGMEWAFRLAQEPRRLFPRYLVTNSQFTGLVGWSVVSRFMSGG